MLEVLTVSTGQLLILGDFNFHVDNDNDHCAKRFLNVLSLFNLVQNVCCPTHNFGHTLDLVITRSFEDILCNLSVYNPNISDHCAVLFNLCHKKTKYQRETFSYRPYKHIDQDVFINDVANMFPSSNPNYVKEMDQITPFGVDDLLFI